MLQNRNGKGITEDPKTEVTPRAERRRYPAEYKLRILDEIDQATQPGEVGSILRREGLYSQLVSKWRAQRAQGGLAGLEVRSRGPKPNPVGNELEELRRENERLRKQLRRAELIIDIQKKVSEILEAEASEEHTAG